MNKKTKLLLILALIGITVPVVAQERAVEVVGPKYPGCHQVSLFDSTTVYMEESGLSHVEQHVRMMMLDRTGCNNNRSFTIDYDPLSAYVEIRKVLVHRANEQHTDTIVASSEQPNIIDYVAPARLIYWGASQKMVQIGHLDPYDEVEIWTYRKGYTYALLGDDERYIPPMRGHFYDIVPFWSNEAVDLKVYRLNILNSKTLQYAVYNGALTIDTTPLADDRTLYTFSRTNIMPLKREPRMVAMNDIACKLLLSTSPNWQAKSMWFYGVNEDYGSFKATPELRDTVAALLINAKSEHDSIATLTHWVADNMRYCGISMGDGEGYTLHNVEMNLTDRCGVCKDKASLLIAMLRAAGFDAYAAMTMAGERIDYIPADQFNHSVCAVRRRNGNIEMLDPTWVPNVRELWSSAEQQQGYLIGMPNGADLMYTPLSPAENHYLKVSNKAKLKRNGTLVGTLTVTAEGQSDNAVRRVFMARQSEWAQNLEHELLSIDPRAEVKSISHTDPDHYLDQPVSITFSYSIPDYAVVTSKKAVFVPLSACLPFRSAMAYMTFDEHADSRQYPFAARCSQLIELTDTTSLPRKYKQMEVATSVNGVSHEAVNFGCRYWLEKKTFYFGESAMYNKRLYNASDWEPLRTVIGYQKSLSTTPVVLMK